MYALKQTITRYANTHTHTLKMTVSVVTYYSRGATDSANYKGMKAYLLQESELDYYRLDSTK